MGGDVGFRWNTGALTDGSPICWWDFRGVRRQTTSIRRLPSRVTLNEREAPTTIRHDISGVMHTLCWHMHHMVLGRCFDHLFTS